MSLQVPRGVYTNKKDISHNPLIPKLMDIYKVAIIFSNKAHCYLALKQDPNYGKTFKVVCAITDNLNADASESFKEDSVVVCNIDFNQDTDQKQKQFCSNLKKIFSSFQPNAVLASEYTISITPEFHGPWVKASLRNTKDAYEVYEICEVNDGSELIATASDPDAAWRIAVSKMADGIYKDHCKKAL